MIKPENEYKTVSDYLTESEMLQQTAEEAAELAQAALKLKRAEDGVNPTPISIEAARAHFIEEIADVYNCIEALELTKEDITAINSIQCDKYRRWVERLITAYDGDKL